VRLQLVLAVAVPALAAALLTSVVLPSEKGRGPFVIVPAGERGDARTLARVADLPPAPTGVAALRPMVVRDGRVRLASGSGGGVDSAEAERPATPVRISIPDAGVEAAIDPVGTGPAGIKIPDVGRAGWYSAGPRPGEPGRAVVLGHLDGTDGPGLFARLPAVRSGTTVTISDAAGDLTRWRIVGKAEVAKSEFPARLVYGASTNPVLVLVTCAGPWLGHSAGYRDNVLVYARLET
jgi:hypothetical protein